MNERNAVLVVNQDGLIQSFCTEAEEMFGFAAEELIGKPVDCIMENSSDYFYHCIDSPQNCRDGFSFFNASTKDGDDFQVKLQVSEIHLNGSTLITGIVRKVDEDDVKFHTKLTENLDEMKALTQQLKAGS